MYFNGMRGLGQSTPEDDVPYITTESGEVVTTYPTVYSGEAARGSFTLPPTVQGATGFGIDWGGIVSTAMKTWGQVETARIPEQAKVRVAEINAQRGYPYYYGAPGSANPLLNPFTTGLPGTLFGVPVTWLLLGAAGIAAVMIFTGSSGKSSKNR